MKSADLRGKGVAILSVAILAVACGGSEPSPAPSASPAPAAATDTADGPGTITGAVTFAGTPPKPRPVRMDSDPQCVAEPGVTSELLVVGPNSGLKNVFVYVKDGLGQRRYAVPSTPVLLDQKGCRYIPHVFGVQVGQTVNVSNSDPLVHNVHAVPKNNREFNIGQPARTPPMPRVFDQPEIGVPFKCDVHGWMNAYAGVLDHPYFAVSKPDGSFSIANLPPGSYTLGAWHERLGTQTLQVTVAAKESKSDANFTFKAAAGAN